MSLTMNGKEIREYLNNTNGWFKDSLPYRAKNGVYFQKGILGLTTQYGLVRFDNGYLGGDKFYPTLSHSETVGDGSIKYDTSVKVEKSKPASLEKMATAIEHNIVKNARRSIKQFRRNND